MASRDIKELVPELQILCREFLARCKAQNIDVMVTCTYRSPEEQDALYAKGRTERGQIVTKAKGGQSKHNVRKAFDIAIRDGKNLIWDTANPVWQKVGQIGEEVGLEWGGRWKIRDFPHFQTKE